MSHRVRRCAATAISAAFAVAACGAAAPGGDAAPAPAPPKVRSSPAGPAAASAAAVRTQPAGTTPGRTSSRRPATGDDTLLLNKAGQIVALDLKDPKGRLRPIADAPLGSVVSPDLSHVATVGRSGVSFVRLRDRKVVATALQADVAAFDAGGSSAVVAVTRGTALDEDDCSRPTELHRVDLASGTVVPVHVSTTPVVPLAASGDQVLVSRPDAECSATQPALLNVMTGRVVEVAPEGLVVAQTRDLNRIWVQRSADAVHRRSWGAVYDATGRLIAQNDHVGTAAFGPDAVLAYSQITYGTPGTAGEFQAQSGKILVGRSEPRRGDRATVMSSEGNLIWDSTGSGFAFRRAAGADGMHLQAWYCVARTLACRALPLKWEQDVELLGFASSDRLS